MFIGPDLCLSHVRGRLHSVSPSPTLLIGLHSTGCNKLILINTTEVFTFIKDPHFCGHVLFCTPFRKAKYCVVPSRAIVKFWCRLHHYHHSHHNHLQVLGLLACTNLLVRRIDPPTSSVVDLVSPLPLGR
jgi:hypothetical protein